jgi:hypothetical protein
MNGTASRAEAELTTSLTIRVMDLFPDKPI